MFSDMLVTQIFKYVKGCSDPIHFIFEINVGKKRIRHTSTLKLNDEFLDSKSIGDNVILFQRRSMSVPPLSDIDFKNKMAWVQTTLNPSRQILENLSK